MERIFMNYTRFLATEIINKKPIEPIEWGYIFHKELNFRYSIDVKEGMVFVERFHNGDWTCVHDYLVYGWNSVSDSTYNYKSRKPR